MCKTDQIRRDYWGFRKFIWELEDFSDNDAKKLQLGILRLLPFWDPTSVGPTVGIYIF